MGHRIRSFLFFTFALLLATGGRAESQQADIIRGRVIGPDSLPLEGVNVTATTLQGNVARTARTGRDGRYTITHPAGEGDYIMTFAALGYAARRYEIKRLADEEILVADARLTRVNTLETIRVAAERQPPSRNEAVADVGGTEQPVESGVLPAADLGDLAAMAATLPGVQLVPGENGEPNGFSVLGLGADQNMTTLNGMSFGGSSLPRDASVSTSLNTSPYDVSRGGFSGGQLNVRTRGGSNFVMRGTSLNVDAPQLQWTDAAAEALGQTYSNISLGGMASGPVTRNRLFYSSSFQAGRRSNDVQSLLNTGTLGLQTAGVARDSVARLVSIMGSRGIPFSVAGVPDSRNMDQGSFFGGLDWAPASSTSGQSLSLNGNFSWNRQNPLFTQPTMLSSSTGDRSGWMTGIQARHTGYLKSVLFSETTVGLSGSRSETEPYLDLPAGRVRVVSDFADGTSSVQTLGFGGGSSLGTTQAQGSAAVMNQLSWFSTNNKHRLGTFSFNSLADLSAGRPASFTRQLSTRKTDASQLIAGVSLGDAWRPSRDVQVQYGARIDANRFLSSPSLNSDVMNAFGVRNDRTPDGVYFSQRLGFSWTYGSAQQIAGFEGASRAPRAVIRGGIGVFQGMPGTQMISTALENTGLAGSTRQLMCVGGSAPVPDWAAYLANPASIPSTCSDGSAVFASSAPNVNLFAGDYRAPRSLRSNLQWSGPVLGNRFNATFDATWSGNYNQSSQVDLNFNPVARFALANEDGRPVFVNPSAIVPSTGAPSFTASRLSASWSRISEARSDLRSESRQLSVRLSPASFSTHFSWSLGYVLSSVREQTRGFGNGGTVGNPLDVSWSRSPFDARHQFTYTLGYNFLDAVRIDWFGQVRSGTPFTPMVVGDVNGDGWSNDRAFVFEPGSTSDPAIASAMQSLLSSSSGKCLRSQLSQLAGRNSCSGPWWSTGTLSISFNPAKVRMPHRASLYLQLSNPLGAADLLVNGSDGLRGWGQTPQPDASLLYVRAFDPVTNQFQYEVNRRFGSTIPATSISRLPTTLTAMVRIDVGPTRERQTLTQQLDRGRTAEGDRLPEQMMRVMLASGGGFPNPLTSILRQQDSLKLDARQADSIATMNRWYATRLDSIWTPVARYLAALPERYDEDEAYGRYIAARRATVDLLSRIGPAVKGLLTDEQYRKLPPFISSHLEPRYLASIREGTVSFTGGRFIPPSGGADRVFVGGGGGGGGGGGTNTVIIRH
jgi:hypothetical protein